MSKIQSTRSSEPSYPSFKPFFTGGAAGMAFSLTHPMNVWKTCLQQIKPTPSNIRGFFQGYPTTFIFMAATFSLQNGSRSAIKEQTGSPLVASIGGSTVTSIILTPAERMLVGKIANKDSFMWITAQKIVRQRGLKEFYAGFTWACSRNTLVFAGINIIGPQIQQNLEAYLPQKCCPIVGLGLAGFLVGFLTHPIDIIKTSIQTGQYTGARKGLQACRDLYRINGFRTFFKGLIPRQILSVAGPIFACMTMQHFEHENTTK